MAKTDPTKPHPRRAGLPPPRTPHTGIPRTGSSHTRTPRTEPIRATKLLAAPFTTPLTVPVRPPQRLPYRPLQDGFLQDGLLQGEQRRWFEGEVGALRRLARTERLFGDYVSAQRLERELDAFITEVAALMGRERG